MLENSVKYFCLCFLETDIFTHVYYPILSNEPQEISLCLSDIINLPWLNTITVCYNLKINQITILQSPPLPRPPDTNILGASLLIPESGLLMSLSGVSGWDEEYRYPDNGSPSPQRRERSKAPLGKVPQSALQGSPRASLLSAGRSWGAQLSFFI